MTKLTKLTGMAKPLASFIRRHLNLGKTLDEIYWTDVEIYNEHRLKAQLGTEWESKLRRAEWYETECARLERKIFHQRYNLKH